MLDSNLVPDLNLFCALTNCVVTVPNPPKVAFLYSSATCNTLIIGNSKTICGVDDVRF